MPAERHDGAVETESDAAVRRRAVAQRAEQEAEPLLGVRPVEAHRVEDALLQVRAGGS